MDLLNMLVDGSSAHFETAESLQGGRSVFLTMNVLTIISVGGRDTVHPGLWS